MTPRTRRTPGSHPEGRSSAPGVVAAPGRQARLFLPSPLWGEGTGVRGRLRLCGAPCARPLRLLLALSALLLAAPAPAPAAGPPARGTEAVPLFGPGEGLRPVPFALAANVVASGGAPGTGPWVSLAALHAGDSRAVDAWVLWKPFLVKHGRIQIGAGTLFLNGLSAGGSPGGAVALAELAALKAGDHAGCWALFDTDRVRRIPGILLMAIEDGKAIASGTPEADAYARILVMAHYTADPAFRRKARTDLGYANLFNDPARYRGAVVRVRGTLRRLRRFDPPPEAADRGVNDLYEGWVFADGFGSYPYCVVFTELPAGFPRELLNKDRIDSAVEVEFNGYFYKKYAYEGGRRARREAPLLIGHSLTSWAVAAPAGEESTAWTHHLMYVLLAAFGGAVVLVVLLAYWYRRVDERVRLRVLAARGEFVPPEPNTAPGAAPPGSAPARRVAPAGAQTGHIPVVGAPGRAGDRRGEAPAARPVGDNGAGGKDLAAAEGDPGS
jgi:hypothetical protein